MTETVHGKIRSRLIAIAATLLLIEVVSRIALSILFNTPFFHTRHVIRHFYPELARADSFRADPDRIDLLVLGGSVVTHQELEIRWNEQDVSAEFCNMEAYMDSARYNVLSLAISGHNSMDSRLKYRYLHRQAHFDALFVYHGINDTRTNNISRDRFDKQYRHIEFYDDLYVFTAHPEIGITATPFLLHWLVHSIRTRNKEYIPKELFYGLLFGEPEPFLEQGADIKSDAVFRSNFEDLIALADKRGQYLMLSTYAWYLPDNYNHDDFKRQLLDYDQQVFPTELYGLPMNVKKGLESHNSIIRSLHIEHPECGFIDMEDKAVQSREHFNDICHLNSEGCALMASELDHALQVKFGHKH